MRYAIAVRLGRPEGLHARTALPRSDWTPHVSPPRHRLKEIVQAGPGRSCCSVFVKILNHHLAEGHDAHRVRQVVVDGQPAPERLAKRRAAGIHQLDVGAVLFGMDNLIEAEDLGLAVAAIGAQKDRPLKGSKHRISRGRKG